MNESNPNQKKIHIKKELANKDNLYSVINLSALKNAMMDLKGETFKLWCYLNKNRDGYTFFLSKVDALQWGIGSKSSYDRAVKELIEKRYLVSVSGNRYNFYEIPREESVIITINKNFIF